MRFPETESNILELKRELPFNNQIVKTAIAFCNTNGGKIVVGVANDGRILGLSDSAIEEATEKFEESIFDSCSPHIIPKLYAQRFGEKAVLIIEISEGMNKPYFLHSDGMDKGTFIRLGSHTVHATSEMIQELKWQSKGIDFEKTPVFRARLNELDNQSIENFMKNRKNSGIATLNEQTLKSYGLISYDQSKTYPSVAGILLFGKEPQLHFSESMIICSEFKGNAGRETIATIDCQGTLFDQFKKAFNFIISRLHKSFTIKSLEREEKLEIPEVAIREALLNIIVHRNYYMKSPSKIAIYDDRVEFFSPGRFPGPFLIQNVCSGITYLRNPAICKVLREANYIEKLGSGLITIFSSYEQYGLETPQLIDGGDCVKCILPRGKKKYEGEKVEDDGKILALFNISQEITLRQVESKLSVSRSTALRRINEMIEQGKIERVGHKRAIRYRLKNKVKDISYVIEEFYWERNLDLLRVRCRVGQVNVNFNFKRATISDRIVDRKIEEWEKAVEGRMRELVDTSKEFRNDLQKELDKVDIKHSELINIDITDEVLSKDYRGFQNLTSYPSNSTGNF